MDPTEQNRRRLVEDMPGAYRDAVERGERTWNTAQMQEEFEAIGFLAPFVVVRRRADGVRGTLLFTHHPRHYFGWEPDA